MEQECLSFEKILDSIKPDYVILYQITLRQDFLLYLICKAKGIKTLPIIEKLILASQNPTAYQQEVKDAVKQLKQLVPTAV